MSILSLDDLKKLYREAEPPCVSIFLPPLRTEPVERLIRFKNALSFAEKRLFEMGLSGPEVNRIVHPLRQWTDQLSFWTGGNSLAILVSRSSQSFYRLPLTLPEMVVVGGRFHLKPLMPLLSGDGRFYILALSINLVRLFEASRFAIREIDKEDIPESLVDALGYDLEQQSLQFHTGAPSRGTDGKRDASFHGHGGGNDDMDGEIEKFLHLVDNGIRKLVESTKAPLVVAAVERMHAAYCQVSKYNNVVVDGVLGNPKNQSNEELHRRSWAIVSPSFRKDQNAALNRFREMAKTSLASSELETIVTAACNSRVDTLFVSVEDQVWGTFDRTKEIIRITDDETEPDRQDLLDLAAIECLLRGGTVYAVKRGDMPTNNPIAALFRYER